MGCKPATVSCAAHKNRWPSSPDGVYWISPTGAPLLAYCDMTLQRELCSELEGEHRGKTRDSSGLAYSMTSVLLAEAGVCKIWAVRGSDDGYPLNELEPVLERPPATTCKTLGFVADALVNKCRYGSNHGNCGFPVPAYHRYGNNCSGCALRAGKFDGYVLQGPQFGTTVISTATGSVSTTCKIR
jgi:hypothetical protein